MIFDVMSERDAIAFSHEEDILPCVIISITNPGDADIVFADNPEIKAVLNMKFYDSVEELYGSITMPDAERIVAFVREWASRVEEIVIHCKEGVSRSAAVCAALMKHMNGDDSEIWEDKMRYHPNKRCYDFVLAALRKGGLYARA